MKQYQTLRAHSTFYMVAGIVLLVFTNAVWYMALLSVFCFIIAVMYNDEADIAKHIHDRLQEPKIDNDIYEHSNQ